MQRRDLFGLAVLASVATTAACGAGDRSPTPTTVRDSAGIAIVENAGDGAWADGEAWHLSTDPGVDIGVLEGAPEYQLYEVQGAVRLSDGRIAVANGGTHEIRLYDASGAYLSAVGGEGEGPGEFATMRSLHRMPGDSLLVDDWRLGRLSIFGPDGGFARTVRLGSGDGLPREPNGVFADGTIMTPASTLFFGSGETPESGMQRDSVAYLRYGPDGAVRDTIASYLGDERYLYVGDGIVWIRPIPFGAITSVAVHGDRFYVGVSEAFEIAVHAADGKLERLIRKAHTGVAVTSNDIDRYRQEQLEGREDEDARRRLERILDEMPSAETFPAFADIAIDAADHLWVEAFRRPGDEQPRWSVFDPDGRLLGTVETPPDFEIFEIGDDYVLGLATDEFDVAYVRLYTLDKPGA